MLTGNAGVLPPMMMKDVRRHYYQNSQGATRAQLRQQSGLGPHPAGAGKGKNICHSGGARVGGIITRV